MQVNLVPSYCRDYVFDIQASLAIRWGYAPDKFPTANTKTGSLGLN